MLKERYRKENTKISGAAAGKARWQSSYDYVVSSFIEKISIFHQTPDIKKHIALSMYTKVES